MSLKEESDGMCEAPLFLPGYCQKFQVWTMADPGISIRGTSIVRFPFVVGMMMLTVFVSSITLNLSFENLEFAFQ